MLGAWTTYVPVRIAVCGYVSTTVSSAAQQCQAGRYYHNSTATVGCRCVVHVSHRTLFPEKNSFRRNPYEVPVCKTESFFCKCVRLSVCPSACFIFSHLNFVPSDRTVFAKTRINSQFVKLSLLFW